ncbi:TetR/AcrR family transcriptional regulator [Fictibacillus iocasae]|uniref:TetR/AcrR family transcriptional regulator n=1 Tax=Fictibacillus iocasae TaxID=2715437 RepID=A0ABW2NVJ4_9BACL
MAPKVSEEHKEQRRLSILDAAKEIFTVKGYNAFVMQDVIEATGMSRGGVYQYFSNKEELFLAVLELSQERSKKEINDIIESSKPIWEELKEMAEEFNDIQEGDYSFGAAQIEFNLADRHLPHKQEFMKKRMKWAMTLYTDLFNEGVSRGEFSPKVPLEHIASYHITFLDGLSIERIFLKAQELSINEQITLFLSHLKTMLGVKEA